MLKMEETLRLLGCLNVCCEIVQLKLEMKQFINLSAKESNGLDIHIYKNAIKLKKDATLIAEKNKSYSTATSLLILSTEEVIKATLVKLHSEGYNIYKLKEASKFFRDHKIRHQIAQIMEFVSGLFEAFIQYDEQKPSAIAKTNIKWLDNLVNGFLDVTKAAKTLIQSKERTEKLKGFNDLKNDGLYVDYQNKIKVPRYRKRPACGFCE